METLHSYFTEAKTLHSKTRIGQMRTHTGIKDTFQLHFLDKLFDSHKNRRNDATKQSALDHAVASLPPDIISPVWRIKGTCLLSIDSMVQWSDIL